jgi:tetratricopeptide (TPR) repeat protein
MEGNQSTEAQYFDQGRIRDVERELRRRIDDDPLDIRAVFECGTIAAFREEFGKAGECFSKILASNWNRNLAVNNLAVIYFRSGLTRAAIEMLLELSRSKDAVPAAVYFNLAMICDRVAAFGGEPPPELIECRLLSVEVRPAQKAAEYFKRCTESAMAWHSGLDGSLYLWPEDVPFSLGFAANLLQPSVEEANRHLYQGIALLRNREWDEALKHLDLVSATLPDASKAAANARTTALLGYSREVRQDIAAKVSAGDYAEAEVEIDKLAKICARLPVEDLLQKLLLEELSEIGNRLDQVEPIVDFALLQVFSRAIKVAVTRVAGAPVAGAEGEVADADVQESSEAHFASKCAIAIEDVLRRFLRIGNYDAGVQLLAWAEQQWFASALSLNWNQEIHHAKALDYWSRAKDAFAREESDLAGRQLGIALVAARQAEAEGFVKVIELQLASLHRPSTLARTIELINQAIVEQRYEEAAQACSEALANNPHDETLVSLLTQALERLRLNAHALARASKWSEAAAAIDRYLVHRPNDHEAQSFRTRMTERQSDERVEAAWNKWQSRDSSVASDLSAEVIGLCERVLALDPAHARAREVLREISAVEARSQAAAAPDSADQLYRDRLMQFEQAIARGSAADALLQLQQLRVLRPDQHHTRQAIERALPLCVASLRNRLELECDAAALDEIERELVLLRSIEPGFAPAAELLDKLRRQRVREDAGRRSLVDASLREADQCLMKLEPAKALKAMEPALVLDLPEARSRLRALQELAVAMAKRQLEILMLRKDEPQTSEQSELTRLLGRMAPQALHDALARINRTHNEGPRADSLRRDVDRIEQDARNSKAPTLGTLWGLDRGIRYLRQRHGELPAPEMARLRAIRRDILTAASPWLRFIYRVTARFTGAPTLYGAVSSP